MQDAVTVRIFDRRGRLLQDLHHPGQRRSGFLPQHVSKRASVQELHHEIRELPSLVRADAEVGDVDDVRVAQAAAGAGFAAKAFEVLGRAGQGRRDDLQRDHPVGAEVQGAVDRAHPSPAEKLLDSILAVDDLADQCNVARLADVRSE